MSDLDFKITIFFNINISKLVHKHILWVPVT